MGWLRRCLGIVWEISGNELPRNLSGNTRLQSSQQAEPLWTDPALKSGISVCELIFIKKKKKAQAGNEWSNILSISSQAKKKQASKQASNQLTNQPTNHRMVFGVLSREA